MGASQLWSCVSPSSAGNGGESASGGAEGGNDVSQLWSCVLSSSAGNGGESALELCVVFFCGEWRRVSFGVVCCFLLRGMEGRRGDGGESALELGAFFFWGAGASQLWSWVLLLSTFFFWGGGRVSFFRLACPTSFDTCQEVCSVRKCALSGRDFVRQEFCQERVLSGRNFVRKGFCQEGILSGRDFVKQEFCQAGILSGRDFVRKGFCQEAGSVRKRALPGRGSAGKCALPGRGSQLWSWVLLLSAFFFLGGGGPVSFRAVKGEGGESALELGVVVVCFLFLGAGG